MPYPSPLRYPGGKGKIANYLKILVLRNQLVGCTYIEPYAGGGSIALGLLFENLVDRININDIDRGIYAFWWSILNETDRFIRCINNSELNIDHWEQQRQTQLSDDASLFDLGFSTFFLNRTNRSGIITGGPIGGKAQSGRWRLDARFNRSALIERIRKIAECKDRILLSQLDAIELMRSISKKDNSQFLYADPPYYARGKSLYRNFYTHRDHQRVAEVIQELEIPWVVSYNDVPQISNLYNGRRTIRYPLSYSAASRYKGQELMVFSDGLRIPTQIAPPNVPKPIVESEKSVSNL